MDYPWIIHGLSMDNPWASMDFQGLGEPASRSRGNRCPAQRYTISLPNCKNPKASLVGEKPKNKENCHKSCLKLMIMGFW